MRSISQALSAGLCGPAGSCTLCPVQGPAHILPWLSDASLLLLSLHLPTPGHTGPSLASPQPCTRVCPHC